MKLPTITVVNHHQLVFEDNEYIGRGSPLGNPFSHMAGTKAETIVATREEAIKQYQEWIETQLYAGNASVIAELDRLAQIAISTGKLVLRCYCAPKPCHGDVIKQILLDAISQQE